ncbi:MAG: hypothetical protein HN621_10535, partial [Porticoccaceae bacterium]|nr:hypothetical protein [Porticoccaceae bacterium]
MILSAMSPSRLLLITLFCTAVQASEPLTEVTAFNYVRAKTAIQFDRYLARAGGQLNAFSHGRKVVGIDARSSKRLNRDTLYSVAIVDISQGSSVILPDAGDLY